MTCWLIHFGGEVWHGSAIVAAHRVATAWNILSVEFQRIIMISADKMKGLKFDGDAQVIYAYAASIFCK